jgi:hypothetical protein
MAPTQAFATRSPSGYSAPPRPPRAGPSLGPTDLAGEAQVVRWSVVALNTIEVPVLTLWFVD